MTESRTTALFVYSAEAEQFLDALKANRQKVHIIPVVITDFIKKPEYYLEESSHVVVSGRLANIKAVMQLAEKHNFSMGIIPGKKQKKLRTGYGLPDKTEEAVEIALSGDPVAIDFVRCNGELLLFRGTIGHLPLMDTHHDTQMLKRAGLSLLKIIRLRPKGFTFSIKEKKPIETAACGCTIIQLHDKSLASRLIEHDNSLTDGMISVLIAAPLSILDYLHFLLQSFQGAFSLKKISRTIGYIKTKQLEINTSPGLDVIIDGEIATTTPVKCEVVPAAIRLNLGSATATSIRRASPSGEQVNIGNLPRDKEVTKAVKKHIPFFGYASEERFKDLFTALRDDARINPIYIILMVLSTLLATVGLYLNSSSVIIGAMLLAPLMAPIVSLAMSLLRHDSTLLIRSLVKVIVGVGIAMAAAACVSLLIPHKPLTAEMQARLNPSLLDLAVAIIAGIAGAYTKSFKEILQSLAGVAIAVALVPPLAVAGIGLGRLDLLFFFQAFLLFSTNFIGITLAAGFTFRVLGFSAVVRNRKGMALVTLLLLLISIPLYFSFSNIVAKTKLEKSWQTDRFLVNGKYLIVKEANLSIQKERKVLYVTLLSRDQLNRNDLALFKKRVQRNFDEKLIVRANITYIP